MTSLPPRPLARLIPAPEAQAWIDGYTFLARAQAEAQDIRASVQEMVDHATAEARAEGRLQGEKEAAALILHAQKDIENWVSKLEPALTALAGDILREILGNIDDVQAIVRATRRALANLREAQAVTLSVAPAVLAKVADQLAGEAGLRVVPDRHLSGRQCLLSTPHSSMDITVDVQLDTILAAMASAHRLPDAGGQGE